LPLLLLALRIRLLTSEIIPAATDVNTPLWTMLFGFIKADNLYLNIVAVALTLITALAVNRLTNHYHFSQKQTNLPAFFYILFCSGFIMIQELQPILLFTPFFVFSMDRLFLEVASPRPMRYVFEATLWTSAASLLYGKGVWFFPLLLLAMEMMRILSFRGFLAAIIGFITPYLFAATWFFYNDTLAQYGEFLTETILNPVAFFKHNVMSHIYIIIASLFVVLGLLSAVRRLSMVKIVTRKYYRFVIWTVFFPSALVFTPYFSFDVLPMVAIGASVVSATMVASWQKSHTREIILLTLLITTLLTQWLVG